MSAVIHRSRTRLVSTAASAALAALSLTACADGGGVQSEGPASSSAAGEQGGGTPQEPAGKGKSGSGNGNEDGNGVGDGINAVPAGSAADKDGAKGAAASGSRSGKAGRKPVTCSAANTEVTVSEVSRPINHLLLTATNTGTAPCFAYSAPLLRFDESAQSALAIVEDSKPQAVVTLAPGESAYAGILTWVPDGGEDLRSRRLDVLFAARNGGSTGSMVKLPLPGEGVTVNDGAAVTYWQTDAATALTW
ncbi:DUF4232 domain-containing protein [Streptomyces sp. WAC 00631]|uniref:DUF4232 domain-containing protein n=1 Tax=Streptomyces sp. WAC 00631 TaxID=2203201 RepID=UPI000F77E8CA|nr:DUF4232 domain-containing protein [Streptomyces sp. WAC 00631]MCC5032861.1 DUF4232 domain-containing protein [Streptomyces sp. WAC 00631]